MDALQAIRYKRGALDLLDQRRLPLETEYLSIKDTVGAWTAIREMAVRGAPAIGVSAALGLAIELHNGGSGSQFGSASEAVDHIGARLDYLVTRCARLPSMLSCLRRRCEHFLQRKFAPCRWTVLDCTVSILTLVRGCLLACFESTERRRRYQVRDGDWGV